MVSAARAAGLGRCAPGCRAWALAGRMRGEAPGPRGVLTGSPGGRSWRARAAGRRIRLDTWPITRIALVRRGRLKFLPPTWLISRNRSGRESNVKAALDAVSASPTDGEIRYTEIRRIEIPSAPELKKLFRTESQAFIVPGGARDWPAISRWSPEFFKRRYGDIRAGYTSACR